MKTLVVYSLPLCKYLLKQGYIISDVAPNRKIQGNLVFYFKNEDGILDAMREHNHPIVNKYKDNICIK